MESCVLQRLLLLFVSPALGSGHVGSIFPLVYPDVEFSLLREESHDNEKQVFRVPKSQVIFEAFSRLGM